MSLNRKIAHNTISQITGKIVSTLLGVVTVGIMTRYLGDDGFGRYSTIMTFLLLVGIMVDFGISMTTVRLIADARFERKSVINNIFTFRLVTSALFYGAAPLLARIFPYPPEVNAGIALGALSFFFVALNQVLNGIFQVELRTGNIMISEVAGRVVTLGGLWYAVGHDLGLLAIIGAVLAGSVINFGSLFIAAQRFDRIRLAWDFSVWKHIIKTTWPIALSIVFNLIYFKADTLILSLTRAQAEVGIYSAPFRVLEILITFPYMFIGVMFPLLTSTWTQKQLGEFSGWLQKSFDALVYAAVPLIVGTQFVADRLMVLVAGPEFLPSGALLRVIIWPTAFIFINVLFGYLIVVLEKQRQMVGAYLGVAAIALTGYLIYIPRYGVWAAAYITVISEALMLATNMAVSIWGTKVFPRVASLGRALVSSAVMGLVLWMLPGIPVLAAIAVAMAVYIAVLYLMGGIRKEMIVEIISRG